MRTAQTRRHTVFKVIATRRLIRGFTALTCAFALTVMLGGTVAAGAIEGDAGGHARIHHKDVGVTTTEWVEAKLRTTTGNRILVFQ
jgi:hypothetical protein